MDILTYGFMQKAFAAGLITALICPVVGMFMVLRRQSLMADGLGHIAFAGVTGASLLQVYPPVGAGALTVAASVGIELLRRRKGQYTDMIMALFFYGGLALAVIFSTMTNIPSSGLMSFLFGSILTVTVEDIRNIAIVAVFTGLLLGRYMSQLAITSFDEEVAAVAGINTDRINLIFSVLIALVVVMGMTIVGILLISALMIIPVATAHLWKLGFWRTLLCSIAYSVVAVLGGLVISFYGDAAPGGTVVMTAITLYVLTLLVTFRR